MAEGTSVWEWQSITICMQIVSEVCGHAHLIEVTCSSLNGATAVWSKKQWKMCTMINLEAILGSS